VRGFSPFGTVSCRSHWQTLFRPFVVALLTAKFSRPVADLVKDRFHLSPGWKLPTPARLNEPHGPGPSGRDLLSFTPYSPALTVCGLEARASKVCHGRPHSGDERNAETAVCRRLPVPLGRTSGLLKTRIFWPINPGVSAISDYSDEPPSSMASTISMHHALRVRHDLQDGKPCCLSRAREAQFSGRVPPSQQRQVTLHVVCDHDIYIAGKSLAEDRGTGEKKASRRAQSPICERPPSASSRKKTNRERSPITRGGTVIVADS
jgi:hypothetical protein